MIIFLLFDSSWNSSSLKQKVHVNSISVPKITLTINALCASMQKDEFFSFVIYSDLFQKHFCYFFFFSRPSVSNLDNQSKKGSVLRWLVCRKVESIWDFKKSMSTIQEEIFPMNPSLNWILNYTATRNFWILVSNILIVPKIHRNFTSGKLHNGHCIFFIEK